MTDARLLHDLHECVSALVTEVSLLDPGWAPAFVPPLPSELPDLPERQSQTPAPAYMSDSLPDPEGPCGCEESLALKARIAELEKNISDLTEDYGDLLITSNANEARADAAQAEAARAVKAANVLLKRRGNAENEAAQLRERAEKALAICDEPTRRDGKRAKELRMAEALRGQ